MTKTFKKIYIVFLAVTMLFGMISVGELASAADLAADISARPGLVATADGNTVTVTNEIVGDIASTTSKLELDITGVTVEWQANLSGAVGPASDYLIKLHGNGAFNVSSCTVSNTGTGGVICVADAGTSVSVGDAAIISDRSGCGIVIDAPDVTVDIMPGGTVISMTNNSNAAIQVNNYLGAQINLTGDGAIISYNSGYAINDGAGVGTRENNTRIVIDGGVIMSGSACAINSTGINSTVEIRGGEVSNTANSNANPTIYMNGGLGDNVIISGGSVQNLATKSTSYTIQTTGNVIVSGGTVSTVAGRAINLVGENSNVTVRGDGVVQASNFDASSGTAICTATANPATVQNASVTIEGGVVSATSGNAIRITGSNSKVAVSGGIVSATSGVAIIADAGISALNAAAKYEIIVSGGSVMADDGLAIQSRGVDSVVIVSDKPDGSGYGGGRGGQVSVLNNGAAIKSDGAVTVNGGLVFAYGSETTTVISAPAERIVWPTSLGGIVGVWNEAAGETLYPQTTTPNTHDLNYSIGSNTLYWYFDPMLGSGIQYISGVTAGFFLLTPVTVTNEYGLIFDASSGMMYIDVDQTGGLSDINLAEPYAVGIFDGYWSGEPGKLTLRGFSWITSARTSLTVVGADVEIILDGDSTFESTSKSGYSCGIRSNSYNLTVNGSGTLTAKGRNDTGSGTYCYGIDIGIMDLTINGGAFIAQGGKAVNFEGPDDSVGPGTTSQYYRWSWSIDYDGGGGYDGGDSDSGYSPEDPFKYFVKDQFIMFQALKPISFSAVEKGGVPGMVDTAGIALVFDQPVDGLYIDNIDITDDTGAVTVAPVGALTGYGDTWMVALEGVVAEGTVNVEIGHFGDFYVLQPSSVPVNVYKAILYKLIIGSSEGGGTSGTVAGDYLAGTPINVTAVANVGYEFNQWNVAGGVVISGGNEENPAEFDMPDCDVILTPEFTALNADVRGDCGLVFNAAEGKLYYDIDESGTLSGTNLDAPFDPSNDWQGTLWDGEPGKLTLYEFFWTTNASTALTLVGDTTVISYGNSVFEGRTNGLKSDSNIIIEGSGELAAKGEFGVDLGNSGRLSIIGGSITAQGSQTAIRWIGGAGEGPANEYYRWEYSGSYDGDDATTGTSDIQFEYYDEDRFIKLQALKPISFTAEQTGGIPGKADSEGIAISFVEQDSSAPVMISGLTVYDVTIRDMTGTAEKSALSPGYEAASNAWTLGLSSVGTEGTVEVEIKPFGEFFVSPSKQVIAVYKADTSTIEPPEDQNKNQGRIYDPGKNDVGNGKETRETSSALNLLTVDEHIQYIRGVGGGIFAPDRDMKRAEVAQMFFNLLSKQNVEISKRFPDVLVGAWYERAVHTLASIGIVEGYPDGRFHPEDSISRAEFVAVLTRFAKYAPDTLPDGSFDDVSVEHWAFEHIDVAIRFGWIIGYNDGSFKPDQQISRAEVVTIMNRALDRLADKVYIDTHLEQERFSDVASSHWAFYDIMEAYHAHDYSRPNGAGSEVWAGE
ncbi:MAG: S-layer homology domain-containing protein [Oscillospiraceae bacterium]|nr:S-layer homology domain-containing protein [Oscillospiraceae bacterium]